MKRLWIGHRGRNDKDGNWCCSNLWSNTISGDEHVYHKIAREGLRPAKAYADMIAAIEKYPTCDFTLFDRPPDRHTEWSGEP